MRIAVVMLCVSHPEWWSITIPSLEHFKWDRYVFYRGEKPTSPYESIELPKRIYEYKNADIGFNRNFIMSILEDYDVVVMVDDDVLVQSTPESPELDTVTVYIPKVKKPMKSNHPRSYGVFAIPRRIWMETGFPEGTNEYIEFTMHMIETRGFIVLKPLKWTHLGGM